MADDFEKLGSKLYASLARTYADDPLVAEIVGDRKPAWEAPLRLFGAVHYLELAGVVRHPWPKFRGVLESHRDWITRFVAEQPVQTNEVQRCWALLPAFLTIADYRPLRLIELGPSAGLNLFWDRHRYRYGDLVWGPLNARLQLTGEARGGPPRELFERRVDVRRRIGIDRRPIDVTSEHGANLLEAFVWADQTGRLDRLRRAIELVREDPPEILEGDYVEILPALLERRDPEALTVVFHSASAVYLRKEDAERLRQTMEQAGEVGPLAWVSFESDEIEAADYHRFALEIQTWPGGERRRLARLDGHANSMVWLGGDPVAGRVVGKN
jgi:hypothetical protein